MMKFQFCLLFFAVLSHITRVFDGEHFDDIRRDTPFAMRPASLVVFYRPGACEARLDKMDLPKLRKAPGFPTRSQLVFNTYDMSKDRDKWYNFYPEIHDLPARFNVTARCPSIILVERDCPIFQPCDDGYHLFKKSRDKDLTKWVYSHLRQEMEFSNPFSTVMYVHVQPAFKDGFETFEIPAFSTATVVAHVSDTFQVTNTTDLNPDIPMDIIMPDHVSAVADISALPDTSEEEIKDRDSFMRRRDRTTCVTHVRNNNAPQVIPSFANGFEKFPLPQEMWDDLLEFLEKNFHRTHMEEFSISQTQMNYYEKPTRLIYLDWNPRMRDRLAKKYIIPMIQKWSGMDDLELTAFYGIREYVNGSWLRGHIDRLDTHVLSGTMTLRIDGEHDEWPLEVIKMDGTRAEITTEPGTIVLYESAKIVHGRPKVFNGDKYYACFVHFRPRNFDETTTWIDYSKQANTAINSHTGKCSPIRSPQLPPHDEL